MTTGQGDGAGLRGGAAGRDGGVAGAPCRAQGLTTHGTTNQVKSVHSGGARAFNRFSGGKAADRMHWCGPSGLGQMQWW